jgi:MerR family transcriptional regulator, repressor of the yfmOP operon
MNSDPSPNPHDDPVFEAETDTCYSIEVIAELAGLSPRTVHYYQERGYIRPASRDAKNAALFDVECLRQLRRIGHLRATCGTNHAGLKLILDLLHEIECLREERRQILR